MRVRICKHCGRKFLVPQHKHYTLCRICYKEWCREELRKQEEIENTIWQEKKQKDLVTFEEALKHYKLVSIKDIKPSPNTLYIIGNGFDLMHRVPSSFYSFRDSLGKHNSLRNMLELALTPEDIWADFENSLAKVDLDLMGGRHILKMWLEDFGFFEDDAGAAEFYMSVETAADPIARISNELPSAFRRWVEKLEVRTDNRPLETLICSEGKVLCFNYTEFPETLYGLKDVCYIHGCRKNNQERLILGHRPGLESNYKEMVVEPHDFREAAIYLAQENVFDLVEQYDRDLTKDSLAIIEQHREFFEGLNDIQQIVVIGHSMSPVDWDYFFKIHEIVPNAFWFFGCFGLSDINNNNQLVQSLGLENYSLFRTDDIRIEPNSRTVEKPVKPQYPEMLVYSKDSTRVIIERSYILKINNDLEMVLPSSTKNVIIIDDFVFVVLNDLEETILLFNSLNDHWVIVDELVSFEHQKLLNRRLKHIYYDSPYITFVYNNRVRKYDLSTGKMILNKHSKDAKNKMYKGEDIIRQFESVNLA